MPESLDDVKEQVEAAARPLTILALAWLMSNPDTKRVRNPEFPR